jgi:hypothetical protein
MKPMRQTDRHTYISQVEKEKDLMVQKEHQDEAAMRRTLNAKMEAKMKLIEKKEQDQEKKMQEHEEADEKARQADIKKASDAAVQKVLDQEAEQRYVSVYLCVYV